MHQTIYRGPTGVRAILTTESPASHYGIPVVRVEGRGVEGWPDLGPADMLPTGLSVAELVIHLLSHGKPPADFGGRVPKAALRAPVLQAARNFLRQWPEGPQLPETGE
jgi:hypothetical protein